MDKCTNKTAIMQWHYALQALEIKSIFFFSNNGVIGETERTHMVDEMMVIRAVAKHETLDNLHF